MIWTSSATVFGLNTHGGEPSPCHIYYHGNKISLKAKGEHGCGARTVHHKGLTSSEPVKQIFAHQKETHLESDCRWATAHLASDNVPHLLQPANDRFTAAAPYTVGEPGWATAVEWWK